MSYYTLTLVIDGSVFSEIVDPSIKLYIVTYLQHKPDCLQEWWIFIICVNHF